MENKIQLIKLREYNTKLNLGNEINAISELTISNLTYIDDIISEIAISYIPISHNELWVNGSKISKYIQKSIDDGLANVTSIDSILKDGYFIYYCNVLEDNLENIVFNYIAEKFNSNLILSNNYDLDFDSTIVESDISELAHTIDRFSGLYELINLCETFNNNFS